MRKSIGALSALGLLAAGCPDTKDGGGSGTVTVTVLGDEGAPFPGASIYVNDASGGLIESLTTGADGKATSSKVPDGGMVTMARDWDGDVLIETIVGVRDGDQVAFSTFYDSIGADVGDPYVGFSGTLPASAYDIEVDAGSCEAYADVSEPGAEIFLTEDCVNASSTYDVLAVANDIDGVPVAYSLLPNAALGASTSMMPAWSTSFASYGATVTNAPPAAAALIVSGTLLEEGGEFDLYSSFDGVPFAAGSATDAVLGPPSFGTSLLRTAIVIYGGGGFFGNISAVLENDPSLTASKSYDYATDFLPQIEGVTSSGTDRPSLSWSGTISGADVVFIGADWDDAGVYTSWSITAPPSVSGSFTFPELPAGVVPAIAPEYSSVGYYDASFITSYDQVRTGDVTLPTGAYTLKITTASP